MTSPAPADAARSATETAPLRCAVIGVGRMGRHHARIWAQGAGANGRTELVGVVDPDEAAAGRILEEWGGTHFRSVDELLAHGVDAVTVAVPTTHHRAVAEPLLAAGVHCLIEKPLAEDAATAEAIAAAAKASGAVLQVGHVVRYDPVMRAILRVAGVVPRFVQMDRISPMTFRSIDVGVVLDMMIHDLDLLMMLVGREPAHVHASAVNVMGEAEDVCNARLEFAPGADHTRGDGERRPGCVANVTASRLALKTERKIRILAEDAYVSADFVSRTGTVVRRTANEAQLEEWKGRLAAGEDLSSVDYRELVEVEPLEVEEGEPLRLQADDFVAAIRDGRKVQVDAEAGAAAVRTAERIVAEAKAAAQRMA